jgi:hypothetical protein
MKSDHYNKQLEKEKEKLNKLADEALKNGIPLNRHEAFMEQNRKKNQQER